MPPTTLPVSGATEMQTPDAADSRVSPTDAMRQASDAWSRTLLATIEQGFCIIEKIATPAGETSNYRYLASDPAFQRHTHLPDPVGKTLLELVPDIEPEIVARCDRVVSTGKPEQFEAYIAAVDLWTAAEAHPTVYPGQLAVLLTDVTERKVAEDALRESEAMLATVLQPALVAIGFFDAQGQILLSNPAMQYYLPSGRMPSRDPERLARWSAHHPDGRRVAPEDFPGARSLRGLSTFPGLEMRYRDDEDRETWALVTSMPLRDEQGQVVGHVATITDIDALK